MGFKQESNMLRIMFLENCSDCYVERDRKRVRPEARKLVRKLVSNPGKRRWRFEQ